MRKLRITWLLIIALILLQYTPSLHVVKSDINITYTENDTAEYKNMIKLNTDEVIGGCYPWLILKHNILNLKTWEYRESFGDTAEQVVCGDKTFLVVGDNGIYLYDKLTGDIMDILLVRGTFLGYKKGLIGVLVKKNNTDTVVVHTQTGDTTIQLPADTIDVAFTVIDTTPVIAYSTYGDNKIEIHITNPVRDMTIASSDTGAVYFIGDLLVYSNYGVRTIKINDPILLSTTDVPSYQVYTPFSIKNILRGTLEHLLVRTDAGMIGSLNLVNHEWRLFGEGEVTPIGIFLYNNNDPHLSTTYVLYNNKWYPVKGKATYMIGNLVFSNYIEAGTNTTTYTPYLYPLKKTLFITNEELKGYLQIPDNGETYLIKIDITGTVILPYGSTIITNNGVIPINDIEIKYPDETPNPISYNNTLITYHVYEFPTNYQVYDNFTGVKYVATGGGKLLIIEEDKAIVYGEDGVESVIEGVWKFGGITSKYVVLYDGAVLRVYTVSGDPVEAYGAFQLETPLYVTYIDGKIYLFLENEEVVVSSNNVTINKYDRPIIKTPEGLQVAMTDKPVVTLGAFKYTIPMYQDISLNKYYVAWNTPPCNCGNETINITMSWYILDIENLAVYTFLNTPVGKVYPLGHYLAYLDETGTLYVIPYYSWAVSNCYIDIKAPDNVDVYANGKWIGRGSFRYYSECNKKITLTATAEYHNPDTKTVYVPVGGTTVKLSPEPKISHVKLVVNKPKDLEVDAVIMTIDNKVVEWSVNETMDLIAGKPYDISVESWEPFDVCDHPEPITGKVFNEGGDILILSCIVSTPVVGLYSEVPTIVTLDNLATKYSVQVSMMGETREFVKLPQLGTYLVTSKPVVEGYSEREFNVTIAKNGVYVIDVTPYKYSKLVITANPRTALIKVSDHNGTEIANGIGKVEVQVLPGNYTISATAGGGYLPLQEEVSVTAGQNKILNLTLVPKPTHQPVKENPPIWKNVKVVSISLVLVAIAVVVSLWYRKRRMGAEIEVGEEV